MLFYCNFCFHQQRSVGFGVRRYPASGARMGDMVNGVMTLTRGVLGVVNDLDTLSLL
jgi:uncharacterized membrane protein